MFRYNTKDTIHEKQIIRSTQRNKEHQKWVEFLLCNLGLAFVDLKFVIPYLQNMYVCIGCTLYNYMIPDFKGSYGGNPKESPWEVRTV